MGSDKIFHEKLGEVIVHKKRGVKRLLLRVDNHGKVHLTLPWWVPKKSGVEFIDQHATWLQKQQEDQSLFVTSDMNIGTKIRVVVEEGASTRYISKFSQSNLRINMPKGTTIDEPAAQTKLKKIITKELKIQAEEKMLKRLSQLSDKHDYTFKSSSIKNLKARWGSCSNKKEIILNTYLVQLPDYLIDYVILHELVHTMHLHHGKAFWDELISVCPNAKIYRKQMKQYQPRLYERKDLTMLMA